jgi:hypothetical protein
MGPQDPSKLVADYLTSEVSELEASGAFSVKEKIPTSIKTLCEKINELPKTKYFNPIKSTANEVWGNIECLPPKEEKRSLDRSLTKLYEECPGLRERAANYCKTIQEFFTDQTLPSDSVFDTIKSDFERIKSDFERLKSEYADVQVWVKKELEPLRERVKRGETVSLTEEQRDHVVYKMRSALPPDVIIACFNESDLKYKTRKAFLEKIENEWDSVCLSLQKTQDYIDIINNFLPILLKLKSLKEDPFILEGKIKKLRALSTQIPCVIEKMKEVLSNCIAEKNELAASLSKFKNEKIQILIDVKQTLQKSEMFIARDAEGARSMPFLEFMAFPGRWKGSDEIFQSSNKEMQDLSKMLVNLWNEISIHHLKAKEELQLAERIQDVYPQLDDISRIIAVITSMGRTLRKTESQYSNASNKFKDIINNFTHLSDSILKKNEYSISRPEQNFNNLGFKVLYEKVIEEMTASIATMKEKFTMSDFSKYELIPYHNETNDKAYTLFMSACTSLLSSQEAILTEIKAKYNHLIGCFDKAIFELDRTYFVHKNIKENYSEQDNVDPRPLYPSETMAWWGSSRHYTSPLA